MGVLGLVGLTSQQNAQLVNDLKYPEDQGLMRVVVFLEVGVHGSVCEMEGAGDDKHCWGMYLSKGQVTVELGIKDDNDTC